MQTCNIIVKDVKDSKRNDNVIHREQANKLVDEAQLSLLQMNCLTVSKGYWPINYETNINFQLPSEFKRVFEEYALAFTKIKAMRKILFHYNLGYVVLHLKFDNTEVTFKCLPVQAVMITYFDEDRMREGQIQSGISSEDLSA